jgi:hypothetical protein
MVPLVCELAGTLGATSWAATAASVDLVVSSVFATSSELLSAGLRLLTTVGCWLIAQTPAIAQLSLGALAVWAHRFYGGSLFGAPGSNMGVKEEMRQVGVCLYDRGVGIVAPFLILIGTSQALAYWLDPEGWALCNPAATVVRYLPLRTCPWVLVPVALRIATAIQRRSPAFVLWSVTLVVASVIAAWAGTTLLRLTSTAAFDTAAVLTLFRAHHCASLCVPLLVYRMVHVGAAKLLPPRIATLASSIVGCWAAFATTKTVAALWPMLAMLRRHWRGRSTSSDTSSA